MGKINNTKVVKNGSGRQNDDQNSEDRGNHKKYKRNVHRGEPLSFHGYGQSHEKCSRIIKIRTWKKDFKPTSGQLKNSGR